MGSIHANLDAQNVPWLLCHERFNQASFPEIVKVFSSTRLDHKRISISTRRRNRPSAGFDTPQMQPWGRRQLKFTSVPAELSVFATEAGIVLD